MKKSASFHQQRAIESARRRAAKRRAADALIARRRAYAILDDCLRRAQHRQLVKREQAS